MEKIKKKKKVKIRAKMLEPRNIGQKAIGAVVTGATAKVIDQFIIPATATKNREAYVGAAEVGVAIGLDSLWGSRNKTVKATSEVMFGHGLTELSNGLLGGFIDDALSSVQTGLRSFFGGNNTSNTNQAALQAAALAAAARNTNKCAAGSVDF